jgi:putative membrane protein
VLGIPSLERLFVPPHEAEQEVRSAAFRLFAEHGIHRTKGRTGMLLLVSELERRAVLLGDSGIHERVGDSGWSDHVGKLVSRIREGRTADGVIEVLESLEARLAAGVPPEPNDENELPNDVIRDT